MSLPISSRGSLPFAVVALIALISSFLVASCVGGSPPSESPAPDTPSAVSSGEDAAAGTRTPSATKPPSSPSATPVLETPSPLVTQPAEPDESPAWTPDPASFPHADLELEATLPWTVLGKPVFVASFIAADFLPSLLGHIRFMAYQERFHYLFDQLRADPTKATFAWGAVEGSDRYTVMTITAVRISSSDGDALAAEWLKMAELLPAHPRVGRLGDKSITWLGWTDDLECFYASGDTLYVLFLGDELDPLGMDRFADALQQMP